MSSGKWLEELVASIERVCGDEGLSVEVGEKRFLPSGVQEAEFDVVVRGKLGSGEFIWLIECRDRPSEGPAPGQWIEQLQGRRQRFNYNKVSAVSTTGFAEGAQEAAKKFDIDLRSMETISHTDVRGWLHSGEMEWINRKCSVRSVHFLLADGTPHSELQELKSQLVGINAGTVTLRTLDGSYSSSPEAIFRLACQREDLYSRSTIDGAPTPLRLNLGLVGSDSPEAYLEIGGKLVHVVGLLMEGEVSQVSQRVPISKVLRYQTVDQQTPIAEVVSFGPVALSSEVAISLEMHHLESGTHILLRQEKMASPNDV